MKAIIIAGLLIASAGASGCATFSQPSQAELFEIEVGRVKSAENKMRANNCGLDPIRGKMPLFGISGIPLKCSQTPPNLPTSSVPLFWSLAG